MSAISQERVSLEEYLRRERASETKHEWVNGEIVAMAGASPRHNLIASNIVAALSARLRAKPCLVLASDQRVNVQATGLMAYPDVAVVCGRPEFHSQDATALINPVILFEVLSGSTEAYDRGAKWAHYQKLLSLQEYVMVSQDERRVEHYRRTQAGQWLLTIFHHAELLLPAVELSLPLEEIYSKLELLLPPS